ncbi:hypothetical protein [Gordonia rubripertincta]|uniref:Uncharacterized protein n=1 Tax=Gordonia rubripertincta TaxID=36822 RepID=A0ABT4MSN5_GORRU|nr:hypothetical protein [Gordonia rubripertincta]MCZ4549834.1 hypothetical protein [Gordonia rubripertincta]
MDSKPSRGAKLKEWIRRYLPCEIAGTIGEFGGAGLVYWTTGSLAAAAVAGTIGASIGYYAIAFGTAARCYHHADSRRRGPLRGVVAALLALRSLLVEFGPAEAVDSLAVRPFAFYVGPLLLGSTLAGWIAAKFFADIIFYLCTIVSYERFGSLIARKQTVPEEAHDGSIDSITVA